MIFSLLFWLQSALAFQARGSAVACSRGKDTTLLSVSSKQERDNLDSSTQPRNTSYSRRKGITKHRLLHDETRETTRKNEVFLTYHETRREVICRTLFVRSITLLSTGLNWSSFPIEAVAASKVSVPEFGVQDWFIKSLVFENILGQGSFKTVYKVSSTTADPVTNQPIQFALAVEPLRTKRDVKDALRGISIAQQLRNSMVSQEEKDSFENIHGWWVQDEDIPAFEQKKPVFSDLENIHRYRNVPSRFLGSKWLIAVKALYDMDLKTFSQKAGAMYSIAEKGDESSMGSRSVLLAGINLLSEQSAFQLSMDLVHAGKCMHSAGLVHRDIKPKNIMLSNGKPVLIDFEFASFVEKKDGVDGQRICVVEPGQVKGEVRYVLVDDVALSQGCQEGDCYAMGKTLYEVMFGEAQGPRASGRQTITESAARSENEAFRAMQQKEATKSRFRLTSSGKKMLLRVIDGLCRQDSPLSFAQAEELLLKETTHN